MTTPKPASAPPADASLHDAAKRLYDAACNGREDCATWYEISNAAKREWLDKAASAQVRDKYCRCEDCHEPDATLCTTCAEMRHTKPAAEPVPVAQGDGSVLAFVRVMRNLRERYPADADVVEAYSNILQAAIIKQAEARTALEASLAACRANEARYLWLRNKAELVDDSDYWLPQVCAWDYKPGPQLNERFPSLDSAIDSLRQEAPHAE